MLVVALFVGLILTGLSVYRYKKLLNPYLLEAYFTILFMIIPQLIMVSINKSAKLFFWSDVVILVYLVSIFLGTLVNIKTTRLAGVKNVKVVNTINFFLYVLLILPILPLLLRFGLSASGFRSFYETVVFSKFASFYELSKIVLYFLIFFKLIRKEKFSLGFFLLFPLVFFYGSRFVVLDFIIYLCVFLEQYKHFGVKKVVAVCLIGAASIALYTTYQFSRVDAQSLFTSYFDIYKNQSFVIDKLLSGESDYYYGEIYFSSYLKYIPRILWEDKPKDFGFAILNYEFLPKEAAGGYMPGFGLGTTFADYGFFSIIALGVMNGLIRNFFYRLFLKSKTNVTFFLYVFPFSIITSLFILSYLFIDTQISILTKEEST